MIKKATSKELMDSIQNTEDSINSLRGEMITLKDSIDKKLQIMKCIEEYVMDRQQKMNRKIENGIQKDSNNRILFADSDIVDGVYTIFGTSIMPQMVHTPQNIFNFDTVTGETYKDNCSITLNDAADPDYRGMLMHDSIVNQPMAFKEFDTPIVTIDVKVNPSQLLGSTEFNTIEILPYLPGSFDILSIEIYSMQDQILKITDPVSTISSTIRDVGATRIMTDRKYDLYECKIQVRLNYANANGRYPFGLKHLYFLNAEYNPDSYVVVRMTQNKYVKSVSEKIKEEKQAKFISTVGESVKVADQTGIVESTLKEEQIKLYMDFNNGVLAYPITTSQGDRINEISRDITEMYVSVPLVRSTISLEFEDITFKS